MTMAGQLCTYGYRHTITDMHLIICERTDQWATVIIPWLPSRVSCIETRSLDEIWKLLVNAPAAVVALELTDGRQEELLTALRRLDVEFPQAVAIVLAERTLAHWEILLREAGAVQFVNSLRAVDQVIQIVAQRAALSPPLAQATNNQSVSWEEQMFATLPWTK
jgi:hypothetical protein